MRKEERREGRKERKKGRNFLYVNRNNMLGISKTTGNRIKDMGYTNVFLCQIKSTVIDMLRK